MDLKRSQCIWQQWPPHQKKIQKVCCCLLTGPRTCGRYLCSIDKLSYPSLSIFSFLLYLLLFLKSSRTFILLLLLLILLPSSVLQWHHEAGNFLSEYDRSNWLFYLGYYLEVSSSLVYVQELSLTILSSPFSSSTTFQSSRSTSAPFFSVSRSLSHIKQCY